MKTCQANNCSYPVFSKGYCKAHQYKRADFDKRSPIQKYYDNLKRDGCVNKNGGLIVSNVDGVIEKRRSGDELQKWFEMVAEEIAKNPHCWNCGEFISEKDYKNSSAHIMPKAIFDSVKLHPLNFVVAGNRCGCHNETHRLDTFSQMPVFGVAVERFKQFEHLILEKHKLLNTFIEYAEIYLKSEATKLKNQIT